MNNENYKNKAIIDVYKNAHIALQSISDLLPSIEDDELKKELQEEYDAYEKVIGEISSYMAKKNIQPKDINPLKKAMLWGSIKMKTLFDNSRNQAAEMMIKGTVMGINELTAMKNEQINFDEEFIAILDKLLKIEEEFEQKLKKFL